MIEPKPNQGDSTGNTPSRLIRLLAALVGAAAIFWLGYGVGRVQNIAQIAGLTRNADVDRYEFSAAGVQVHYERLGGAGKPYIRSADGYELLDVSDWDHNSVITVDSSTYELIRLYPTSSVDYGRNRIAETLQGTGWLAEREITLDPNGTVHIVSTFVARQPVQKVQLSLAHFHTVLAGAKVQPTQVTAGITRTDCPAACIS